MSTGIVSTRTPAWVWWLAGFGAFVFAAVIGVVAWVVNEGYAIFKADAIEAMQSDATIEAELGEIRDIRLDFMRTGTMTSADGFAFHVTGSRASGVVAADFQTTLQGERLGRGTLELGDGRTLRLPSRQD